MKSRIEWMTLAVGVGVLLFVLELVRKRRLKEEYSLLWIGASLVILGLSLNRPALDWLSRLLGIYYPPMALFVCGAFFALVLAIHFSLVISRLSGESRTLAQEVGLLRLEVRELKERLAGRSGRGDGGGESGPAPGAGASG
ncbi:MAG: DUF2304 domain-containing protein [Candidatus Riflebacteria bacterium]|nr:DUF2304 domain-containing protein [Candidatus Riflebacteria bacterium]